MSTKVQRAYQQVNDAGHLLIHIYNPEKNSEGKQEVKTTLAFDCTVFPEKIANFCTAKGFGFYAAGRYAGAADEEMTPEDIADACNLLYKEMQAGEFQPGRGSGDTRPTPFHEALAEHLKMPVAVVVEKIKNDKTTFSQAKLAAMGRHPVISSITARIVKERAAEAEKLAKGKVKDAEALDIAGLFDTAA